MNEVTALRKEVQRYINTADEKTLKVIQAILEVQQEDDWWDELPIKVQGEIDEALADLDKGKGIPHEEVMKKYKKWFTR